MVEGGKIDHACHGNDAATAFEEVIDMDNAVKVAYEFYKKHPKETLIVVTADHETGGMGLGTIKYELSLKSLASQKQSQDILSRYITNLRKDKTIKFLGRIYNHYWLIKWLLEGTAIILGARKDVA